jgi:subtilisin family serine protease
LLLTAGLAAPLVAADLAPGRSPFAPLDCVLEPVRNLAVRVADSAVEDRDKILARLGIAGWHRAGQRGKGIKIAVLDSGFKEYRSFLGTALPRQVQVHSCRPDGDIEARESQHGILCAEVIHAVAPDAELLLVNWDTESPANFLEAVRWAKAQGAKVLSCSLIMPSWSDGEGGGTVNHELRKILGDKSAAGSLLFFASAGNTAQRHWCGQVQCDAAGYHLWSDGHRNNSITPWGNERVSVELYGPCCANLELQVYELGTGKVVGKSVASCSCSPCGSPCATVRFLPQPGSRYYARIHCGAEYHNDKADPVHLVVLGGGLHYTTTCGSIPFPAECPGVVAVGAVGSDGARLAYSSCGPNSCLPKPDFVAEVPFPSLWRDRPFSGTSAAAPQAAGLAALVWARHPTWTAEQVNQFFRTIARDLGPKGHDVETGHGLLVLPPPG